MTEPFDAIHTPRCRIRPLKGDDANAVQAITDAFVTSHVHFLPEPFTIADARALIGSNRDHCFFGVWDSMCADLRGVIGAHLMHDREIEVGYWFSTDARGKGLATEAVRAMVKELSIIYPGRRIIAECHSDNRRSWALLERIGFTATHIAGNRPGRMVLSWDPG